MKYNVEFSIVQQSRFRTRVEADSPEEAKTKARALKAADLPTWVPFNDADCGWNVEPADAPLAEKQEADALDSGCPPDEVREALRRVVDYLYDDEAGDYQTRTRGDQREHIFQAVLCLARWLSRFEP